MPSFLVQLLGTIKPVILQMGRRWYVIFACMLLSVAFVVVWAQVQPPQYVTTMTVTAPDAGNSGLSNAQSAIGASAGLIGLSMIGRSSQFESYLVLLQSASVSGELMHNPHIMRLLFGSGVDPATGKWRDSTRRRLKGLVFEAFGVHRSPKPTLDDVNLVVNSMLVINFAPMTRSMATVSCTSSDPYTCRELMLAVDHAAQARLDGIALDNVQRMAKYLEDVLSKVHEVSLQQSLSNVMAVTQAQAVLNGISEQQRAVVLDEPTVPSRPAFPKPAFLIQLAMFVGLVLGGALVWLTRNTKFDRFVEIKARRIRR